MDKLKISKNILGYCRVSTTEQAESGNGIEGQKRIMNDFCKKHDVKLTKFYSDEGVSGTMEASKRQQLSSLLRDINKNDILLVYKRCRLSRSMSDMCVIEARIKQKGATILSCDNEGLYGDTATASLFINMVDSFSAFERNLGIERTKNALAAKKARKESFQFIWYD